MHIQNGDVDIWVDDDGDVTVSGKHISGELMLSEAEKLRDNLTEAIRELRKSKGVDRT